MDIVKTCFFLQVVIHLPYESNTETRRHKRYSPHPAFSMFSTGISRMAFPGFAMSPSLNGGMSSYSSECIRDDIVCPAWCIMEDEWGCKTCPCGPANGMSPPIAHSSHPEAKHSESKHDCMGTILCMLTCKDGYELGERQENGCQTCTCKKKNETTNARTSQQGTDCIGPACSAKNGMRIMSQLLSTPRPSPSTPVTTPQPRKCQATEICKQTCKYTVKLGKPGPDGCPTCLCIRIIQNTTQTTTETPIHEKCQKVIACTQSCRNGYQLGPDTEENGCPLCRCIQVPTTPKHKTLLLIPLTPEPLVPPTPAPCDEVTQCIRTCSFGYQIESQMYSTECPQCRCIIPLTPPPPTTTRKPDFITVLHTCPEAVHCMKSCSTGYTLKTDNGHDCPVCSCNRGPTILLLCAEPLACPRGCSVGYKCDELGCPTCNCIKPSETKFAVEIHTAMSQSTVNCLPNFSCVQKCDFGYKTGAKGCPTCECVKPVTVQIPIPHNIATAFVTQAPPILSVTQGMPLLTANQVMALVPAKQEPPQVIYSSGIGCLGPACSAPGARVPVPSSQFIDTHSSGALLYNHGSVIGHESTTSLISGPISIQPTSGTLTEHLSSAGTHSSANSTIPTLENIVKLCPEIATCLEICKAGFDIGNAEPGECPPCRCLAPSKPMVSKTEAMPAVAEVCPDTVKCIIDCNGPYNLTTTGSTCPTCSCLEKASACDGEMCHSIHGTKFIPSTTPSPGECLAILQCVLTCQRGYDVGEVGRDGCPSCQCAN